MICMDFYQEGYGVRLVNLSMVGQASRYSQACVKTCASSLRLGTGDVGV